MKHKIKLQCVTYGIIMYHAKIVMTTGDVHVTRKKDTKYQNIYEDKKIRS
jgi:hypothetical protein